jgi:acyl-CoA synthetase (NDP forming)
MESVLNRGKLKELELIFYPRSIAVVGVSSDENRIASQWLKSLISGGFRGKLYGVNPKGGEIFGRRIWPRLSSLQGPVDLVIVCTPRSSVLDILRQCAHKRIQSVYFYTAGFSEAGEPEWAAVEKEMVRIARDGGFRIIGPNCFGVYNPGHGISYGPFNAMAPLGSVGLSARAAGTWARSWSTA